MAKRTWQSRRESHLALRYQSVWAVPATTMPDGKLRLPTRRSQLTYLGREPSLFGFFRLTTRPPLRATHKRPALRCCICTAICDHASQRGHCQVLLQEAC
jgi:hypothetical protein